MNKPVIFCVDDENIVLQALKADLIHIYDHQFLIETAESGPEALEIFKELLGNRYDIPVIISDYIMPGMKGDELLKNIHQLSPKTLTVLLTGQAQIEGITNAINNANLYRYVEKPWGKDILKGIIDEGLSSYSWNQKLTQEYLDLLRMMDNLTTEIQETALKLTGSGEKTEAIENLNVEGQSTGLLADAQPNNHLFIEEIISSLNTVKANLDSLTQSPSLNNSEADHSAFEREETWYQANYAEIARITALINNLKEGRHE